MKYAKPELRLMTNALEAVRGTKGMPIRADSSPPHLVNATTNAYEADE
jgi:hypothetical protein